MPKQTWISPIEKIKRIKTSMTPKSKIIGDFIISHPRKAVFMTTRNLASACQTSEATVVRFVTQLGYAGYGEFLQNLRAAVDAELTFFDRSAILATKDNKSQAFKRWILEGVENLKFLYKAISETDLEQAIEAIRDSRHLFVIGSRLTYSLAHFMGWMLLKSRPNVQILNGSDSTCIDRLYAAQSDTLSVIITMSRYPNELIRLAKVIRRLNNNLLLITDSRRCPLIPFASQSLIIPWLQIPSSYKNMNLLLSLINFIVMQVATSDDKFHSYQKLVEDAYQENDLLFSMYHFNDEDNI